VLLLVWIGFFAWSIVDARLKTGKWQFPDVINTLISLGIAVALIEAPAFGPRLAPEGAPIYGYGTMLLIGFVSAIWLAIVRSRRAGMPSETIWDLAVWLFLGGILGARVFYLVQYGHQV